MDCSVPWLPLTDSPAPCTVKYKFFGSHTAHFFQETLQLTAINSIVASGTLPLPQELSFNCLWGRIYEQHASQPDLSSVLQHNRAARTEEGFLINSRNKDRVLYFQYIIGSQTIRLSARLIPDNITKPTFPFFHRRRRHSTPKEQHNPM